MRNPHYSLRVSTVAIHLLNVEICVGTCHRISRNHRAFVVLSSCRIYDNTSGDCTGDCDGDESYHGVQVLSFHFEWERL